MVGCDGMTCSHAKIEKGQMVCGKGYPLQLKKCLKGGLACYKERGKGVRGK